MSLLPMPCHLRFHIPRPYTYTKREGRWTNLELVHDRDNLSLESFIGDFPPSEVDLIADEDDGDVDAELAEVGKPVGGDAVERVWVVDGVDDADDVGFAAFCFEVLFILGAGCAQCAQKVVVQEGRRARDVHPESTM